MGAFVLHYLTGFGVFFAVSYVSLFLKKSPFMHI